MLCDDIQSLRRILSQNQTIAVVGLSANWYRPSFFAAKYMQEYGYRIIPVNPNYDEILGEKCYASLEDIPESIDVVDVFQRSDAVLPFAHSAVALNASVLWMQLGIYNEEAVKVAIEAGMDVVANRCIKIEHARLFGGLNFIGVDTKVISSERPRWIV
ncbi:MAG: CoA-binding protein [Acidiferrobacterales bacterium]|nr:CoA-binding protein [Acidiferrobacterales bacterium]